MSNSATALHSAVKLCKISLIQELIRDGADIDARDQYGDTCLHYAIWARNENIFTLLLSAGTSPNRANQIGETPLSMAVILDNWFIVKQLVEAGADVNFICYRAELYTETALQVLMLLIILELHFHNLQRSKKSYRCTIAFSSHVGEVFISSFPETIFFSEIHQRSFYKKSYNKSSYMEGFA
ncbi:hypothetical protein QAD02_016124 [Eretmocerus hayati]|uniref:Uncharacterized protein n=1 Tax=Eretmocerus hayati TaxID=131215 RepID=A0ACC2PD43_9HYME|nr:hypothetical protein QAD02_016124 [Eretmocerus hayati]